VIKVTTELIKVEGFIEYEWARLVTFLFDSINLFKI